MSERKISTLLYGLEAPDIDIGESNVVSAGRIKEITMKKIKDIGGVRPRRKNRLAKVALVAAVLALVLGVSAGAYMGLSHHSDPAGVLGEFFASESYSKGAQIVEFEKLEIEGEVYEKLKTNMPAWERLPMDEVVAEKYIYPHVYGLEESVSWGGYTLDFEAVLYDSATGCGLLYYTVENPEGVGGYKIGVNGEIDWPADSPYYVSLTHGERTFIDETRTTDTKLYVCSYFIVIEDWGEMLIRLGNGENRGGRDRAEMCLRLPDEKLVALSFDGGNVVLTPIGMRVDKKALDLRLKNDIDHITIRFADGSEYIVEQDDEHDYISNRAYALENADGSVSRTIFNSIVDVENVVEVEIEGQVFKAE